MLYSTLSILKVFLLARSKIVFVEATKTFLELGEYKSVFQEFLCFVSYSYLLTNLPVKSVDTISFP
jgi:hypothetical protein